MARVNSKAKTIPERKTVNVKLDIETKSKLETLAYIEGASEQDLGAIAIKEYLDKYADVIAEVEKAKAKFKK